MNIYRVIFVMNAVHSCTPAADTIVMDGNYLYYQLKGQPIYALIKAEGENAAIKKAEELLAKKPQANY